MRKLAVGMMAGAAMLLSPSVAQAAPTIPWGGLQIEGTTWGTNCHLNRCWGEGDISAHGGSGAVIFVHAASFWSVIKCGAGIVAWAASNYILVGKLKKAGGVYKVAKKVWRAKGRRKKAEALRDVFGYVLGTGAVVEACT